MDRQKIQEAFDSYLTRNSAEFHVHLGFVRVEEFHQYGYKFGRWYDMIFLLHYFC